MMYRLGELFCGAGGLALGAIHADIGQSDVNIIHAWANDIDLDACNTYRHNLCPMSPGSVICEDVHQLDLDKLSAIDAFAFGFPCNDFSLVGEQKGFKGNFGPLYTYGVKVLKKFQPQWFLAENVGGLASANEKGAFPKILHDLRSAGYRVYPHHYKFEQYSVPQARHRIIIIGIRKDIDQIYYPPDPAQYKSCDVSAKTAIENPPIIEAAANHECSKPSDRVKERLSYIKPGQNVFNADMPDRLRLNVKGAKMSMIYRRLDPNKPAYTLIASGGGGTHVYHYEKLRALTNRERARLQTFPDTYVFLGSKEHVRKQIGMAVPPRGAKIIFEAVLKTMAGIEYPHIPCNLG